MGKGKLEVYMSKAEYIDAIQWTWGCSRSEAERKYKEYMHEKRQIALDEMLKDYKDQCRKAFYED